MILPQLGALALGAEGVGMFFSEDNNYLRARGDPVGTRLARAAKQQNIMPLGCDRCCYQREIDAKLVGGATTGCFPNFLPTAGRKHVRPDFHAVTTGN